MRREIYGARHAESTLAVTSTLATFTRARRALEHDQLTRDLLVELRRLRAELQALRVALTGRAA